MLTCVILLNCSLLNAARAFQNNPLNMTAITSIEPIKHSGKWDFWTQEQVNMQNKRGLRGIRPLIQTTEFFNQDTDMKTTYSALLTTLTLARGLCVCLCVCVHSLTRLNDRAGCFSLRFRLRSRVGDVRKHSKGAFETMNRWSFTKTLIWGCISMR